MTAAHARHVRDRPRRHGDDLHDPGGVPAGRLHDRHRRPVLQVVRADDRLRGGDVAARRVHARPDAVVALRALRPARGADARRASGRLLERWGRVYDRLDRLYHRVLGWALAHPWTVLAAAAVVFVGEPRRRSAFIGTEFMPDEDRGEFDVARRPAAGHVVRRERRGASPASRSRCSRIPEVRQVFTTVGVERRDAQVAAPRQDDAGRTSASAGMQAIKSDLRARLAAIPFADVTVADPSSCRARRTRPPINVFVRGDDMEELQRAQRRAGRAQVRQIPGRRGRQQHARERPARDGGAGQPRAAPPTWASASAPSPCSCAAWSRASCRRKLRDGDSEYDIRVRLAPEFRNDFAAIARTPLYSPTGAAGPHRRHRDDGAGRRPEQHRARAAPPPGQDRHRPQRAARSATSPRTSRRSSRA